MLVVGHVGWGPRLQPTRLMRNEQYAHISLWCLLSAPLLIGCDLERDIGEFSDTFESTVPFHGVVLVKLTPMK